MRLYLEIECSCRLLQHNDMSAKTHEKYSRLVLPGEICLMDPLYFFRSIWVSGFQGTK